MKYSHVLLMIVCIVLLAAPSFAYRSTGITDGSAPNRINGEMVPVEIPPPPIDAIDHLVSVGILSSGDRAFLIGFANNPNDYSEFEIQSTLNSILRKIIQYWELYELSEATWNALQTVGKWLASVDGTDNGNIGFNGYPGYQEN